MPKTVAEPSATSVSVLRCTNKNPSNIFDFSAKIRGRVYAVAEELDHPDVELLEVDDLYRRVGLSRRRFIWMAYGSGPQPVGAAIAYRGPLGLNFSLVENRCDLLVDGSLDSEMLENVCLALLQHVKSAYTDFAPPCFPISTDEHCAKILTLHGAKPVHTYRQSIWLRDGFADWYRHVEKFKNKVSSRQNVDLPCK